MRIWLITVGEPLPTDGPDERLLRTGILGETLSRAGHEVVWWTSSFDHVRKCQRTPNDTKIALADRYSLYLLKGCSYAANVSLRRVRNHRQVAQRFRKIARQEPPPDLILVSWPTLELCVEAVELGQSWGVPVVLDIRDMWPNAIVDCLPRPLRPLARVGLSRAYRDAASAARGATAITGITDNVVDWALNFASRTRGPLDQAFPMGYRARSVEGSLEADEFWRAAGLARADGEFVVCFFGAIGRHFEIETIVGAAKRLEVGGRSVKFVLCGEGPQRQHWDRLTAECDNILVPGWVGAAQIQSLMKLSAVGLAPYKSSWDFMLSIPNKPIEYMSAGLPVISSLKGELADLLSESGAGLSYQNDDPGDLARVLADCYDRPALLDKMSSAATRLYRSQFVAESVYANMADYLLGMASTGKRYQAA